MTDLLCLIYLPLPHLRKHGCNSRVATPTLDAHRCGVRWSMPLTACPCCITFLFLFLFLFFFFFHFFICGFGPIQAKFASNRADSSLIRSYRLTIETGRNKPKRVEIGFELDRNSSKIKKNKIKIKKQNSPF